MTTPSSKQPTPTDNNLTWQEAKARTQGVERQIVAQLDPSIVASVDQHATGGLWSCGGPRETGSDSHAYQWVGDTLITFRGPQDPQRIFIEMQQYWQEQPGFRAVPDQTQPDGAPALNILRRKYEGYYLALWNENTQLDITSFSDCFTLPDDVDPGGDF